LRVSKHGIEYVQFSAKQGLVYGQKKASTQVEAFNKYGGYLLSQVKDQVPSAMRDLTTLFGMGRGEHPRQNHHKKVELCSNIVILGKLIIKSFLGKTEEIKIKHTGN
jgi:hypothetical protein